MKNYRQIYRPYEIRLLTVKIAERRNAYLSGHPLKEVELPLARGLPVKTVFAYYQNGRGYQQTDGLGNFTSSGYEAADNLHG